MTVTDSTWRTICTSITGSKHQRQRRECEDYAANTATSIGLKIVALSDGHGSAQSPKSRDGARFAVESAIEVIEGITSNMSSQSSLSRTGQVFRRELEGNSRLVRKVIRRWRSKVRKDAQSSKTSSTSQSEELKPGERTSHEPFGPTNSEDKNKTETKENEGENSFIEYGATILVAAAAPKYRFFFQIGDGDILSIPSNPNRDDEILRESWVFSASSDHLGEKTSSLAMERPEKYANTKFISSQSTTYSDAPFLFLSTDGYKNSFVDGEGFVEAIRDFRDLFHSEKVKKTDFEKERGKVQSQLQRWMKAASKNGSGDDISVGILFNSRNVGITSTHLSFEEDSKESRESVEHPTSQNKLEENDASKNSDTYTMESCSSSKDNDLSEDDDSTST